MPDLAEAVAEQRTSQKRPFPDDLSNSISLNSGSYAGVVPTSQKIGTSDHHHHQNGNKKICISPSDSFMASPFEPSFASYVEQTPSTPSSRDFTASNPPLANTTIISSGVGPTPAASPRNQPQTPGAPAVTPTASTTTTKLRTASGPSSGASLDELQAENKLLRQRLAKFQSELEKRSQPESSMILKLAKKDQDIGALTAELQALRRQQSDRDLESSPTKLLDPTWALLYGAMKKEVEEKNKKIEHLQREILGVSFTPYSITGKKLVSKLKALQTENEELGKQLYQGRVEQLQTALAMEKAVVEKLERRLRESDQLSLELDRENEAMQETIFELQHRLHDHEPKGLHERPQQQLHERSGGARDESEPSVVRGLQESVDSRKPQGSSDSEADAPEVEDAALEE
ncbi:uncharacterized protein EV422DRAFT_185033 [Fimicolochytrium jonesii]|uniref:uncharacterized protein n=1 Tax=Fimicolochytrium jonesii TaxID=1396493 RepID=UPI0022FE5212|nr:uncharacterized protein EV422DRAFT_185033 [Fimicolochytrium jonesii]KAI8818394.1 hypothetical protein EV422DRAFT_185033 [Fimicolochytrium jonesii]